jgi:hypothetical protein
VEEALAEERRVGWGYRIPMAGVRYYLFLDKEPGAAVAQGPAGQAGLEGTAEAEVRPSAV